MTGEYEIVADTVEGPRWTWPLGERPSHDLPSLAPAHRRLYLLERDGRVTCLE